MISATALFAQPIDKPIEQPDNVKVSLIQKFSSFIEWPKALEAQFALCVVADHPLLPSLKTYYEKEPIAERPVTIQTIRRPNALAGCNVIFIAQKDMDDLARYRAAAVKNNVLLIAEGVNAARYGVHIAFYVEAGRVQRPRVNRKALEAAGLKASFRLLHEAEIVE